MFDFAKRTYVDLCMMWVKVYLRHPINREYTRLTFEYQQLKGKEQRRWYYKSRLANDQQQMVLERDYRRGNAMNFLAAAFAVSATALLLYMSF